MEEYSEEEHTCNNIIDLCELYSYNMLVNEDRICFQLKTKDDPGKEDVLEKEDVPEKEDEIALMMIGMPRFYDISIKSIKQFLANYTDVSCFFTFWDIDGTIINLSKYDDCDPNYFEQNMVSMKIIENIFKNFRPTVLQFLKYSEYESEINKLNNLINIPDQKHGHETYKKMVVSLSLIHNIGYECIKNGNKLNKYKFFFKIRPDSIINDKVDLKLLQNNIITPLSNSHDVYFEETKISLNDQICFTDNLQHLYNVCNLYNDLLLIYTSINKIKVLKEEKKFFYESLIGYYIKHMCEIKVLEIPIQTGIVRNDNILYYVKDSSMGHKRLSYEEYNLFRNEI